MYELDKAAFGSFLAQLRREKGMTQRELAADLYVSDKAVSKWERGLSVPDISLLVPLAEILNVTVAELLQGRRVEEEQRFTREETEELIRKALTFSAEPPERRQARTRKFLPLYAVYVLLGLVGTAVVCAAGLAGTEGAKALLIIMRSSASCMEPTPCSGCRRPCRATTMRTASATLRRAGSTSTSRACTTTTATGCMCLNGCGCGAWCLWS